MVLSSPATACAGIALKFKLRKIEIEPNQITIIRNAIAVKQAWELLRNHHEMSSFDSQVSLLMNVIDKKFEEHLFKIDMIIQSGMELNRRLPVIPVLRSVASYAYDEFGVDELILEVLPPPGGSTSKST